MQGKIVIGTEIDTKGLEQGIKEIEKHNAEINVTTDDEWAKNLESAVNKYEQSQQEALESARGLAETSKDNVQSLYDMKMQLDEMVSNYNSFKKEKIFTEEDINNSEKLKEEIIELARQLEKISGQKITIPGITDATQTVNVGGLKNGFESLYKSAKRLAMGIIGVRAAYGLVRKAASSYLADNQRTAGNIANLWTGLGVLMGNIIEGIVRMLKKAVTAILYFASVLTGVNYIAKANAAILKKQKKATAGLRKEQEKFTASFDEMNILQDNSSSNVGGGVSADTGGELFDVEELGKAKEIIEKIAIALKPVWEIIKGIVKFALEHPGVILGLLAGAKVIGMIAKIMGVGGIAGTGLLGLFGVLTAIASIGAIVISVISLIKGFKETKEYNEEVEKLTKNQAKLSEEIQEKVRAADLDKKQIKDLVQNYAGLNIVKSEEISNTKKQRSEYNGFQRATASLSGELSRQNATIQGNVKTMYEQIKTMKEWYEQGLLNKEETNEYRILLEDFRVAVGESTEEQKRFVDEFTRTSEEANELNGYINEVNTAYKNYKTNAKNAADQSEKTAEKIDEVGDAMSDLKKNNDVKLKITADTKEAFNKMKELYNFGPLKDVFKFAGKKLGLATGGIYVPPKLAVGGIINRPGRGVPIGSAIGGERGAEGVIPLTDAQQMALLGEAIGKYVNINATIPVQIGNRQVAKEIRKINAENDFASNR